MNRIQTYPKGTIIANILVIMQTILAIMLGINPTENKTSFTRLDSKTHPRAPICVPLTDLR